MREQLVERLWCPTCHADVSLDAGERDDDHVMTGTLKCDNADCAAEYPIVRGVPRMVPGQLPDDMAMTADNFGKSWKIWKDVDDDRYRWQFLRWLTPMEPEQFVGQRVLDCGCGKGRHVRVVHEFGAAEVIGVDLSEAVEVAFENTKHMPNAHIVQGDLYRLPVKPGFDVAYSIGVLHHTPDPQGAYKSMVEHVRPGGVVGAWVYGRENNAWIIYGLNPIRIGITRYLPTAIVRGIAWLLSVVLFVIITCLYRPLNKIGVRLFYVDYMLYLRDLGFKETQHIVYDHLIAPTAVYLPKGEVQRWLDEAGLEDASLSWIQQVSWAAIGRKPEP